MRACLLRTPAPVSTRPLSVEEVNEPQPGPAELLIRVRACGICRTDLHVVEGELAPRRSPVIPGHQAVGVVETVGPEVREFVRGDRVGAAWLRSTCRTCRFCARGQENLCEAPRFNGWTDDGGFAERMAAPAAFVYRMPDRFDDLQAAPLLCAGIIGYRALRLTGIASWSGARLGIHGFGAAGHIAIQIARARGAEVYVMTRDQERHQDLAAELGARWVGGAFDRPPVLLDASILFAPAGAIVPSALAALDKGGTLVLGGIHMSPIPALDYPLIYDERVIRSVSNNTREDGQEFLDEAARVPIATRVVPFDMASANEALMALKSDAIRGAGVLIVAAQTA